LLLAMVFSQSVMNERFAGSFLCSLSKNTGRPAGHVVAPVSRKPTCGCGFPEPKTVSDQMGSDKAIIRRVKCATAEMQAKFTGSTHISAKPYHPAFITERRHVPEGRSP